MLELEDLFAELKQSRRTAAWCEDLKRYARQAFTPDSNRNLARWTEALASLPSAHTRSVRLDLPAVTCLGEAPEHPLREALKKLSPWRKGPFQLFQVAIDTEWRSNLKWDRLAPHLDLSNKSVLDVGCGNGYYGWRMLGAGARLVVGLEPYLLYIMQYRALRSYLGALPNYVVPAPDTAIPANLGAFDVVFSMGVLYHRKSPVEHLQSLRHALVPGGELLLETLVIQGLGAEVLIPSDRYARMNNVWFIPTCSLLERMLVRCGFSQVEVLDLSRTTVQEQRSTEWMPFESLQDCLDPGDPRLTVEGYPAPLRVAVRAVRK